MRFITNIVRRATRTKPQLVERPKARVPGRSPRSRLRQEVLGILS